VKGQGTCNLLGSPLGGVNRNDSDRAGGIDVRLIRSWSLTVQPVSYSIFNDIVDDSVWSSSLTVGEGAAEGKWCEVDIGDSNDSGLSDCAMIRIVDLTSGDVFLEGVWGRGGAVESRETR
jgi:hypothetical protein